MSDLLCRKHRAMIEVRGVSEKTVVAVLRVRAMREILGFKTFLLTGQDTDRVLPICCSLGDRAVTDAILNKGPRKRQMANPPIGAKKDD